MEMMKPFIRINAPQGDEMSPKKGDTSSLHPDLPNNLQEIRVGDYLIRSEKISGDSIDGYSLVLYNNAIIYEGEMVRSRKNGFGV
jgi:hypothetical protein